MILRVKDWHRFQHYSRRRPLWIKLYRDLLDDCAFQRLQVASKALAPMLWLLASEFENGEIRMSTEDLAFRLRMPEKELTRALNELIEKGFFIDASKPLASCYQSASLETERETEKETTLSGKPDVAPLNDYRPRAKAILAFLNEKTGRRYQPIPANLDFIVARLKDGATDAECRQVIARKSLDWSGDEKMAVYLRPATLFNRVKFAQYQGELVVPK